MNCACGEDVSPAAIAYGQKIEIEAFRCDDCLDIITNRKWRTQFPPRDHAVTIATILAKPKGVRSAKVTVRPKMIRVPKPPKIILPPKPVVPLNYERDPNCQICSLAHQFGKVAWCICFRAKEKKS